MEKQASTPTPRAVPAATVIAKKDVVLKKDKPLLQEDIALVSQLRTNYLALKSNQNDVHRYQSNMEHKLLELLEKRPPHRRSLPFNNEQLDAGNANSIYSSQELPDIYE